MPNPNVITIERNIPIPGYSWTRRAIKYSFMDNLEVNDSFYINGNTPDFTPISVRAYVYALNSKTDSSRKYTIRTIEGQSKNPRAIRVWRTA